MPSSSSSWVRRMRRSRVAACLASSTQQMNSLRASGVMSFQAASAVSLPLNASRRSAGSSCTTPPGTCGLLMEATITPRTKFPALRECLSPIKKVQLLDTGSLAVAQWYVSEEAPCR